jgi:regulator of protease activity HflC (stomatin/prohibitin superfamily)
MGQAVFILAVIVLVLIFSSLRVCSEWQRKVVLRLGRFAGVRGPGLFFLFPFVERTPFTIDLRTVTSSFTAEQTLTRDNVPVNVDTILFWRVIDPARAVLEVANYAAAVQGAAQTALRDVIGRSDLSQVLSERTALDAAMTQTLDAQTEPWGVKVESVQMRDIKIPDVLQDAMSRVAQAERERQARMVLGDSEVQVAQRFADAGKLYDANPMALHLRGMNMLYEVMKTGGTATVIVPSTAVESMSFGGISGVTALAREAAKSVGDGGPRTPPAPPPVASPPPPFGIPGPPTGSS